MHYTVFFMFFSISIATVNIFCSNDIPESISHDDTNYSFIPYEQRSVYIKNAVGVVREPMVQRFKLNQSSSEILFVRYDDLNKAIITAFGLPENYDIAIVRGRNILQKNYFHQISHYAHLVFLPAQVLKKK